MLGFGNSGCLGSTLHIAVFNAPLYYFSYILILSLSVGSATIVNRVMSFDLAQRLFSTNHLFGRVVLSILCCRSAIQRKTQ